MAISNYERVGKTMELLRGGLAPFVEREVKSRMGSTEAEHLITDFAERERNLAGTPIVQWDVAALLNFMWIKWNEIFSRTLGNAERSLVSELKEYRNRWAHQGTFSTDDAYRVLDSAERLLTAITAPESDELEKMKNDLLRLRYEEQIRNEKRKTLSSTIESAVSTALKPWREVITPHHDVATGQYQQAEFAADLWQVHLGEGSDEYRDPIEFFKRTYLTESLKNLLINGINRITGTGGDPIVQLQTNFGGGKTHSMLALYHLFSGINPAELLGIDEILQKCSVRTLPAVRRVILVGNKISPGNPRKKSDGTLVRTLWGELAWQLGGKKAYDRIAADDERATNPGDVLRELFNEYGPCIILIDEWVAYARQLHDQGDLPGGNFETHFSFAQALTEAVKGAKNCLLVISLPASDTSGSPHVLADDVEVGGERGREALLRLRNVIGRLESSWRPASTEEGFEIVRRRLFEPIRSEAAFKDRDVVANAFTELYRNQQQEFPADCGTIVYEKRIKAAYPIHPEVFDRLYSDWSTLLKFQRTRGVLRLMAAVIHSLWENGDKNPLILPSTIPIDDPRVQSELTRYLSDNWAPIIDKDIDGPSSLPRQIDGSVTNLGKYAATRRVARTIFLGSAPTSDAAHHGLEDRRIKLGCVMPGESPAIFGDALRRLAGSATYLYQDGSHFWYSTQPTVTKLAEDRAEQLKREPDKVSAEIEYRVREDLKQKGDFARIHPFPHGNQDVPDDRDARLVVLDTAHAYTKSTTCEALQEARRILEFRGTAPRLYRNTLVFLAADANRLQDLDEAVRNYLAWKSIVNEKNQLNLSPFQATQAEQQLASMDATVNARIPETYQWVLVPVQHTPSDQITWEAIKLTGSEPLALRASKKLRQGDLLVSSFGPSILRRDMDTIPLWRGDHVSVRQLCEDYACYLYLTRLIGAEALIACIQSGLSLPSWEQDSFAWADSWDEQAQRYQGLRYGQTIYALNPDSPGLLVKPEVALRQLERETEYKQPVTEPQLPATPNEGAHTEVADQPLKVISNRPKRFHGTVELDPERVGRDAGIIADEVISHLVGRKGAHVTVTLEIQAEIPDGADENLIRIVTENARTLKFKTQGFERE
ncbi:MAG: Swt1 family HEPN domain-containing protein [Spirochaetota bacterium]|jgi:predicted AAA+ superfamily ATPase